jgi:hypothetical protein
MSLSTDQEALLAQHGILQLGRCVFVVASLIHNIDEARDDDDDISLVEKAGIAFDLLQNVRSATKHLATVPEELKRMDGTDVELLADILFPALHGRPSHQRELANACIGVVRELVHLYRVAVDPPKAATR